MTTITFDEPIDLPRNHFKNLDDFQTYLIKELQDKELTENHKKILDNRLTEAEKFPENYMSVKELKSSLKRK